MAAPPPELKAWLELISAVVVLIGIPVGLVRYFLAVRKEQHDREYGTYNALDEKFVEYQHLCMDHSDLDIFDVPHPPSGPLSPEQQKQELIAFTMLFSIFERAFLMYHDESTELKKKAMGGMGRVHSIVQHEAEFSGCLGGQWGHV